MKNLASKLTSAALISAAALTYTGCTTNTTIHRSTLEDNYQTYNAPTLGAVNPDVVVGEYQDLTSAQVRDAIPTKAGIQTPLETQLLYFNNSDNFPGRQEVNGAAGFSIDSNLNDTVDQYMVLFIDQETTPAMRRAGIAYDNNFDVYVDFVDKDQMHNAFGEDPGLVYIEHKDGSYKAFAATSAAEAGIFTLASGGNVAGGLIWGTGSMAVKSGSHYLLGDKPQNLFGRSEIVRTDATYGQLNVELFNDLRDKLGGNTLSVNNQDNALSLFSYSPEAFRGMHVTTVNGEKELTVTEGLAEGVNEFIFTPDFRLESVEPGSPSYMYLIGLISAGVSGHLVGNGSDGGSSNNGGGNGNNNPGNIFDIDGGFGGVGQ